MHIYRDRCVYCERVTDHARDDMPVDGRKKDTRCRSCGKTVWEAVRARNLKQRGEEPETAAPAAPGRLTVTELVHKWCQDPELQLLLRKDVEELLAMERDTATGIERSRCAALARLEAVRLCSTNFSDFAEELEQG